MKIAKRLMTTCLAVIMVLNLMTMPVSASNTTTGSYVRISINGQQYSSDYTAYDTERMADKHHITLYVDKDDFPVTAKIVGKNGNAQVYTFSSYGTKRLEVADMDDLSFSIVSLATFYIATPIMMAAEPHRYAFIDIKSPSEKPTNTHAATSSSSKPQDNSASSTVDNKMKILLDEIDFPYYSNDSYIEELKAFLNGEWDGSRREGGDDLSWVTSIRYVFKRTYYWLATDFINGEMYECSTNVDYKGYKEVIPGNTTDQEYSLAVSRVNGEVEMWSLFEQQDAWKIGAIASGEEHFENIIPLATNTSGKDDCRVFVSTLDADGVQHMYQLLPGGKVKKTI